MLFDGFVGPGSVLGPRPAIGVAGSVDDIALRHEFFLRLERFAGEPRDDAV